MEGKGPNKSLQRHKGKNSAKKETRVKRNFKTALGDARSKERKKFLFFLYIYLFILVWWASGFFHGSLLQLAARLTRSDR